MHDRRSFLTLLAAAAAAGPVETARAQRTAPPPAADAPADIRKSLLISMLPQDRSYADRFAIVREAGFDAIEMRTIARAEEAAEAREGSAKAGVRIHSVMNEDHWRFPLSSADADVVGR